MNSSQWLVAHSLEIVGYLLAIVLIPRILLERRHPGATIAWVLAVGLVPYLGVPLYFLIGGRRIRKISKKRDWDVRQERADREPTVQDLLPENSRKIAHLLMRAGTFPPAQHNAVRIIDDGVDAYETLVDLLEHADNSIEIATFILGRDEVGRHLVELLVKKARQGVEIRLLLDALGCLRTRGSFVDPVREAGGSVGVFLPLLSMRRRWSANLRNHRKMTIVDGQKALVGGMNLAKEYMGPKPYSSRWKDVSLTITGTGAGYVRTIFWTDWTYSTNEPIHPAVLCPLPSPRQGDESIVQVVGDGPDVPDRPLYSGVLAALNRAKERIWVVTPYFVPDEALSAALELAARMGCDVRLIMPERSNHPLVDLAGSSFLVDLMAAGVRFYCYQPGMLHAKLIAIDHQLAVVGSANMDIRSFQLNFEIATFLYDPRNVEEVLHVVESIMKDSREVRMEEITRKSKFRKFSEDICRVFSPLF